MKKKTTRFLLAEQHRNTRHDAIDAINSARNTFVELNYVPDHVWEAMVNRVMNLEMRSPEGAPTKDDICPGCKRYRFDQVHDVIPIGGEWKVREHCKKSHFSWIYSEDRQPIEQCQDYKESTVS